jgi:hypothetical protein
VTADLHGLHASLWDTGNPIGVTSYNNPKGNADTERVMRTLKEKCLSTRVETVKPL